MSQLGSQGLVAVADGHHGVDQGVVTLLGEGWAGQVADQGLDPTLGAGRLDHVSVLGDRPADDAVDQGLGQLGAVTEVVADQASLHAGLRGDALEGAALQAVLQDALFERTEDLGAPGRRHAGPAYGSLALRHLGIIPAAGQILCQV